MAQLGSLGSQPGDWWDFGRGLLNVGASAGNENVPGIIGGTAKVGSGLAGLADYPGLSQWLGSVGGPLSLATGLASGNPLQSILGGAQTASLASGAFGGPTIGSLVGSGLSGLSSFGPTGALAAGGALAEEGAALGVGAAGAAGGLAGSLAGGLALGPFALLAAGGLHALTSGGGDMFDAIFGTDHTQPWSQMREYKNYADAFPGLVDRRVAGAQTFNNLGDYDTPDEIAQALKIASSGRSANTEPAAWNLSHQPTALPGLKPMDLSGWEKASPELSGHNWGSFLNLMDKGQNMGLDTGGMTGEWNLAEPGSGANTTGEDYRTRLGSYGTQNQSHGLREQTQEAQDLGNSVAGIGMDLGIDWKKQDPSGNYENFDSSQLADYGLTPGNYGPAVLNYLRSFDPNVTNHANWSKYTQALGDPSALDILGLTPRANPIPTYIQPPELNLGGG